MEKERVELHVHTKMSEKDGVASISEYIKCAVGRGYPAIAVTDHGCVQAFPEAMRTAETYKKQGEKIKIIYGMEAYCKDNTEAQPFHLTILVQNQVGLKNLYLLISQSYLHFFQGVPVIMKEELQKHRTGLLIGSGCGNGRLFCACAREKSPEELYTIARDYDFLEIQPVWNCKHITLDGEKIQKELQRINRIIVQIGEKMQIPICATGNVHYLESEDTQARCILKNSRGISENTSQDTLHFRSTEEMLETFNWLGKKKAYEVVVENTNKIAERIEEVRPIPQVRFRPNIATVEEQLEKIVRDRAKTLYGKVLPDRIKERLEKELSVVRKQKTASLFFIAQMQIERSKQQGYPVMTRGSAGASLLSYLLGISEVNPLPPHYRCPNCRYIEFFSKTGDVSGFDLPQKNCPVCGENMERDGQDIPWQDLLGRDGEKIPDFDLNFSGEYIERGQAKQYLEEMFGKMHVVKAGTVMTVSERLAMGYIREYEKNKDMEFSKEQRARLVNLLTGVKRASSCQPGGFFVIPENFSAEDFTPLQYERNNPNWEICTHFDFCDLTATLLNLVNLRSNVLSLYHYLEKSTGISAAKASIFDPAVYERLFSTASPETTGEYPFLDVIKFVLNGIPKERLKGILPKGFTGVRKVFESTFPKAYSTELALAMIRLGWYRLYYPKEFHKAYRCTFDDFENKTVSQ